MDEEESALPASGRGDWAARLDRVELLVRQDNDFTPGVPLEVGGLFHLVGMVGAGKSTPLEILTYRQVTKARSSAGGSPSWSATWPRPSRSSTPSPASGWRPRPVLGQSTRERNIQRLHRRLETAGAPADDHSRSSRLPVPASACALDALRGLEADRPLRVSEPPARGCTKRRTPHALGRRRRRRRPAPAAPSRGLPALEPVPALPRRPRPGHGPGLGRHPGEPCAQRGPAAPGRGRLPLPGARLPAKPPHHRRRGRPRSGAARRRVRPVRHADRGVPRVLAGRSPGPHGHRARPPGRLQLSAQETDNWATPSTPSPAPPTGYTRSSPRTSRCADSVTADDSSPFTLHQRLLSELVPADQARPRKKTGKGEHDAAALGALIAERDRISADPRRRPRRPAPSPARTRQHARDARRRPGPADPGAAARLRRRTCARARLEAPCSPCCPKRPGLWSRRTWTPTCCGSSSP